MKKIIIKNFWLKALALFLAVIIWLYVVGELDKGTLEEKAVFDQFIPYKLTAKQVPIKIDLIGKPHEGYRVLNDSISIKPSHCVILASKNLLKSINYVMTEEIDVSVVTRSIAKQVRIRPMAAGISFEKDFMVNVLVPIEKVEPEPKAGK